MGEIPTLVIGNKLYSSWSLRPWLLMRHFGLPFQEVEILLGNPDSKELARRYGPSGLVPVLHAGDIVAWESLAILQTISEMHPEIQVWPKDPVARALARSMAAEMHAGFTSLRKGCPMNLGKRFPAKDRGEAIAQDVARIESMWAEARQRFGKGGPFLFGAFGAVDAMYAPVVTRFETYSIPVSATTLAYMDAILALPAYQQWLAAALEEPWVIANSEVDEEPVTVLRSPGAIPA